jgi:UDP-N-acetylmuramoyl-L-alanyl-D-glutamate--2,6-diaminopimelate ligase
MMTAERRHGEIHLSELLFADAVLEGGLDREVSGVAVDSREVERGTAFFARRGLTHDAAAFIDDALRAGASAIVREGESVVRLLEGGVPEIHVADVAASAGEAAHRFYGRPSESMRVIGITGTNGKTSVSHFIAHALGPELQAHGGAIGVIGTLGCGRPGALEPGQLTTPDVVNLHRELAGFQAQGIGDVVMEVSSHALSQGRTEGVRFDTGVFTNLSRDHLDFHGDMQAYAESKGRLFCSAGISNAVINADDEFGRQLLSAYRDDLNVIAYTLAEADARAPYPVLKGRLERADEAGIRVLIESQFGNGALSVALLGRFNAHNLLAAAGALLCGGMEFKQVLDLLSDVPVVPGRMQRFGGVEEAPLVVVDYAHTPDALSAALLALRDHCNGRLWCVFGCGGDRDEGKRSQMGAIADELADVLVLTDDNPRSEDGAKIIAGIMHGVARKATAGNGLFIEQDRAAAISFAVADAGINDVVLVAGKGHETYQETMGARSPFSDAAAVRSALETRRSC